MCINFIKTEQHTLHFQLTEQNIFNYKNFVLYIASQYIVKSRVEPMQVIFTKNIIHLYIAISNEKNLSHVLSYTIKFTSM